MTREDNGFSIAVVCFGIALIVLVILAAALF